MTREDMLDLLREGICDVKFTKQDGTEREMRCTINQNHIPKDKMPNGGVDYTTTVIRAYELGKSQWRSFRVDSVKTFEKVK